MGLSLLFSIFFVMVSPARDASDPSITIRLGNTTIKAALNEFQRQTSRIVIFSDDRAEIMQRKFVDFSDVDEETFLTSLLSGSGMTWRNSGNYIIIGPKDKPVQQNPPPTNSVPVTVNGTVKDKNGVPLVGAVVSVTVDGTPSHKTTDARGDYSVTFRRSGSVVFNVTYLGMKPYTAAYTGQERLDVVMEEDVFGVSNVVVTGYGTVDRRQLTSSVTTVKASDLDLLGALTVDQMLEGKAPGLMVLNLSAQPGAASKMRIRSPGTFTGSREPLWVIDGVIYEDPVPLTAAEINSLDQVNLIGNAITGINPNDIESINILKDAPATALYGTRASNGVIVITTKRGTTGSVSVTYSGSMNVVDRPRYKDFNLMNSKERIDVSREIVDRSLVFPTVWPNYTTYRTPLAYEKALEDYWHHGDYGRFTNEVSRLETLNYDWFKDLYRPAINQNHSVGLSGGTEGVKYYFSVGYDNQKGTERGVDVNRLTSRLNMDVNLRKNILVSIGMDGSVQKATYNRTAESKFTGQPFIFDEAYYTSRAVEAKDPDGNLVFIDRVANEVKSAWYENTSAKYNILHERDNYANKIDNKAWNVNVAVKWDILPWLAVRSRAAYRNTTNLQEEWVNEDTYYMATLRSYDQFEENLQKEVIKVHSKAPFGGLYSGGQVSQDSYSIQNQLLINKTIRDDHYLTFEFTQEAYSTKYKGVTKWEAPGYNHDQGRKFISLPSVNPNYTESAIYQGYEYQAMLQWFTRQFEHSVYPYITESVTNTMSYLGWLNYSYKNRYVANFTIRSDGSNTFGQYQRYKYRPIWSASARWNVHSESFLDDFLALDELALRVSYGFRGMTPSKSPYMILSNYGRNNSYYYPENTAYLENFPDANLKWETTTTTNVGLDYSFFAGRLFGVIDFDYSRSKDVILSRPVSLVNGTGYELYNGGKTEAKAFEFSINGSVIRNEKFRWNIHFNFTRIKENILTGTNVVAGEVSVLNYLGVSGEEIRMKGFPKEGFFSYRYTGLDDVGKPTFASLLDKYDSSYEKLRDMLVYSGQRLPKGYGGFGTEFGFKEFTLSANFTYKFGHKVRLLQLYNRKNYMPLPHLNMRSEFVDRWRKPGDVTDIPALSDDLYRINPENPEAVRAVDALFLVNGDGTTLYDLYNYSDLRTARGDHIKFQSLTLSYRLPSRILELSGLKGATIRFQVQNIAVITFDKKIKGQHPDQISSVGLPSLPSFNLGLNLSF